MNEEVTAWLVRVAESGKVNAARAAAVLVELDRLADIERGVIEWRNDTDLTHPSVSEVAIRDAMNDVLERNAS